MNYKNALLLTLVLFFQYSYAQNFPDGTAIPAWFSDTTIAAPETLGKQYRITDYGVKADSSIVQTETIQAVIDQAAAQGGGVIVVPKGVFLSGSLFFKPNTHLHLSDGATLKCSDDISDFKVVDTRIEGQTVKYFAALINADGLDGFTLSGSGTVDGNGLRYWKAFWLRREWNPDCTNMDEQRPRLLFVSNSTNVQVSGVSLMNSPFWTSHYYKCKNLKILGVTIKAGTGSGSETHAPSSDGIDLDVCENVLIKNCYIAVNDDGICLKGGKGPTAHQDPNNGPNRNIIIEDNTIENCPALTLGSESVFSHNVIMRRGTLKNASQLLRLKMRPDTRQQHAHILIENMQGSAKRFLAIEPWTQFFDLKGHPEPTSSASDITIRNSKVRVGTFLRIRDSEQYSLANINLEDLEITAENEGDTQLDFIQNLQMKDVVLNGEQVHIR